MQEDENESAYLVATIHAVADDSQSVYQIKASLRKLCGYGLPFVLMGDFNSQPDRYIPKEQLTSIRSGKKIELPDDFGQQVYMVYPNGLTQGANGNRERLLDYVLFLVT